MSSIDETAPLLGPSTDAPSSTRFPPVRRLQLVAFLMVTAMSMPNASLLYLVREMSCDAYYSDHPVPPHGDRCHVPAVESLAAANVARMGTLQTAGSIACIFATQFLISRVGTKFALFQGSLWSAARMLVHIYAVAIGGQRGVTITLWAALLCVLGSPGGFFLAANSTLVHMVDEADRTAMFGVLGGAQMAGYATGLLGGAAAYRQWGLGGPFVASFVMITAVVALGIILIPSSASTASSQAQTGQQPKKKQSALSAVRLILPCGAGTGPAALPLLVFGVFLSVLATGFVPFALQLVGQDEFGFEPDTTSMMLFMTMVVRSVFLTSAFPRMIRAGRARYLPAKGAEESSDNGNGNGNGGDANGNGHEEPATLDDAGACAAATFDLHFLRLSILVDGILTGLCALVSQPWHLFLAAAVLPLASGTAPAARGAVTELVGPEHTQLALSAVSLVESLASVATLGVFGAVYSVLSAHGTPTLVFVANAAVALVAFVVLVPVRVPRVRLT